MNHDTWLSYLLAAAGLPLSPGPHGLLALTHGALHGRREALWTIAGGAIGFVVLIALSMFGIDALLQTSTVWLAVLKWVGGAYLVWLGVQVWRSPPIGVEPGAAPTAPRAGWSIVTELLLAGLAHRVRPWLARVGRRFNQARGGLFVAIGAALPLRA